MALIPIYFTVADYYKIDNSSATGIQAGTLLTLTTGSDEDAYVAPATATSIVVGVAGDSFRSNLPATPSGYAADIVINAQGSVTRSQDRISDMYMETLASGKMTIYTVGGKFASTMYQSGLTFAIGQKLYSNANGLLTNVNGGGNAVGVVVGTPTAYPSGVPGTGTPDNSISLGTYLTFILNLG